MAIKMHIRLACVSAAALLSGLAVSTEANAGAYGVQEQSTQFEGTSYAGAAAGGDLSSMFWNPAATAALTGMNFSSSATLLLPSTSITAASDSVLVNTYGLSANGGSFGIDAFVPAMYANYQLNDRWYLGLALNSPFGFTTKPSSNWAGAPIEITSKIFTFDINPTLAYKLTPTVTIGAGLQVEYFKLSEISGPLAAGPLNPLPLSGRTASVDDWGVGATAGIIWQPSALTSIGLGYRSEVQVDPSGTCRGIGLTNVQAALAGGSPSGCFGGVSIHSSTTLPQSLTLSGRQQITPQFAVLGTIEWTNWSVVKKSFAYNDAGVAVDSLPVTFDDGWFFALGGEYAYSPWLTLRAGLSYELSPVTDANRTQFLPDADRWTPSIGASYKWSDRLTIDFAYSHIFFANGNLKETATLPAPIGTITLLDATANVDVDMVSLGLKYRFDAPVAIEPYK